MDYQTQTLPDGFQKDGFKTDGFKKDGFKTNGFKKDGFKTDGFIDRFIKEGWITGMTGAGQ